MRYNVFARPRSSMDRVPDFESVGCVFESRRGHLLFTYIINNNTPIKVSPLVYNINGFLQIMERLNRQIRHRTRMVGASPYGQSALMLVCNRVKHFDSLTMAAKRTCTSNIWRNYYQVIPKCAENN